MRRTDRRVVLRFLIPYLVFLVMLLLGGIFASQFALSILEAETISSHSARLAWGTEILDAQFKETRAVIEQIELDSNVRRFQHISDPYVGPNVFQVIRTMEGLPDHSLWNEALITYFVAFRENGRVLAPGFSYSLSEFYHGVLGQTGDAEEWFASTFRAEHDGTVLQQRLLLHGDRPQRAILYVRSLGPRGYSKAAVITAISLDWIESVLNRVRDEEATWVFLAADETNILASVPNNVPIPEATMEIAKSGTTVVRNVNGEATFVSSFTSTPWNWTIVAGKPYTSAMARVANARRAAIVLAAVLAVVGSLVSVVLAYRTSKPFRALVRMLGEPNPRERYADPLVGIGARVRALIEDRDALQTAAADDMILLRAAFGMKLLSGQAAAQEDQDALARYLGVEWEGTTLVCVVVLLPDGTARHGRSQPRRLAETKALLREALRSIGVGTAIVTDPDDRSLAAILAFAEEGEVRRAIQRELGAILERAPIAGLRDVRIVVGEPCTDPMDLAPSYGRAMAVSRLAMYGTDAITWIEDQISLTDRTALGEREELWLKNAILTGDSDRLHETLDLLFADVLRQKRVGAVTIEVFCGHVVGVVLRALDLLGLESSGVVSEVNEILEGEYGRLSPIAWAIRVAEAACDAVRRNTVDRHTLIVKQIMEYIDDNLSDPGLSLEQVAALVRFSPVHLSRFFHARTGQTFRGYVEAKRMERAKTLLVSSDRPVKEIAHSVGYHSLNTFSRAFKRHNHCTASSLRP